MVNRHVFSTYTDGEFFLKQGGSFPEQKRVFSGREKYDIRQKGAKA